MSRSSSVSPGQCLLAALVAAPVLVLAVALPLTAARDTDGLIFYPLDDTYIHMALARHRIESGIWGINPDEFAFASSSPLWTFLLALAFRILGIHVWLPLALNVLLGAGCVAIALRLVGPH